MVRSNKGKSISAAKRSREPDLRRWPKDIEYRQLQSSALPTELSRVSYSPP